MVLRILALSILGLYAHDFLAKLTMYGGSIAGDEVKKGTGE